MSAEVVDRTPDWLEGEGDEAPANEFVYTSHFSKDAIDRARRAAVDPQRHLWIRVRVIHTHTGVYILCLIVLLSLYPLGITKESN